MRQNVRYQALVIPSKIRVEIRISVDDQRNPEYSSTSETGDKNVSLSIFPFIGISITRPGELGEDGKRVRAPWNPNDHLTMTKYNLPIFCSYLDEVREGMKIKELYVYQGKRLELNEETAKNVRRAFMIGQTAVELSPVVIVQEDDTRVEGIKMKFNNEQSHVLLTLNDIWSLYYTLTHTSIDNIVWNMYDAYIDKKSLPKFANKASIDLQPKIDIDIPF